MADIKVGDEDKRRDRAIKALAAHRISIDPRHKLTLEQIEALADVARTFR